MKVIIAGSRTFNDYDRLKTECNLFLSAMDDIRIVSGGAKGADMLGERYAKEHGYFIIRYNPDWELHGKKAGYLRNVEMAEIADACICFWDGKSKGTKMMIDIAKQHNLKLAVIDSFGE